MNSTYKMDNDFEEKRKKKILDNGKNNVRSVYSMGPFTVLPRRAFNDHSIIYIAPTSAATHA